MKIFKYKIFKILILVVLLGILLGIISFIMIDKSIIKNDLINYINLIKNGNYNYLEGLTNSLTSNISFSFFIWLFGIVFIFSFINIILIIYKGISLGFMLSSIIYVFKAKGLILGLILSLNSILNIIVYIVLCYYSINFAIKSYNAFKNNKLVNFKSFYIRYIYIYLILLGVLILNSLLEIYVSSNIIKFVV